MLTCPQDATGKLSRRLEVKNVMISDFVIMPDGDRIVAVYTDLKRSIINNQLKPSMSGRIADPPTSVPAPAAGNGTSGDQNSVSTNAMDSGIPHGWRRTATGLTFTPPNAGSAPETEEAVHGFRYGTMNHGIMIISTSSKEVLEYVLLIPSIREMTLIV